MRHRIAALWAVAVVCTLAADAVADVRVFVLRHFADSLALQEIDLREGEERTWTLGEDGFIDLVLPPGPGGSAGIVQTAMSPTTTATVRDGQLVVTTRAMGKVFERPAPSEAERAELDIHVSARSANGATFAGFIRGGRTIEADPAQIIEDPFGDAIPLRPGDCVIYTTTFEARKPSATPVSGSAPVRSVAGHHLVGAATPGGGEGMFVVDLAAGATIVEKSFLPPGAVVRPAETVQYSAEGVQRLAAEIGGATNAAAPLGYTTLAELRIGEIVFRDVEALVMESLPALAEPIAGILGVDLLGRAASVTLPFPAEGEAGVMTLGEPGAEAGAIELPLSFMGTRAFCRGKINGAAVSFLVDTGSPRTILDERTAKLAKVAPDGAAREARGIGGTGASLRPATAESITLGEARLEAAPVDVGSLPLFAKFKGPVPVGVLGNATLSRFRSVTMDFRGSRLILLP